MGGVLLAAASRDEWLDDYLASVNLRGLTGHTITSPGELRQELHKIRNRGWAVVDQELEEGLRSLAAPIRDGDGRVIAAVNVSTHAGRRSLESVLAGPAPPAARHRRAHRTKPAAGARTSGGARRSAT